MSARLQVGNADNIDTFGKQSRPPRPLAGPAKIKIMIFAGNPGSGLYYKAFLESLNDACKGLADIFLPSHLAHDLMSAHSDLVGTRSHARTRTKELHALTLLQSPSWSTWKGRLSTRSTT